MVREVHYQKSQPEKIPFFNNFGNLQRFTFSQMFHSWNTGFADSCNYKECGVCFFDITFLLAKYVGVWKDII